MKTISLLLAGLSFFSAPGLRADPPAATKPWVTVATPIEDLEAFEAQKARQKTLKSVVLTTKGILGVAGTYYSFNKGLKAGQELMDLDRKLEKTASRTSATEQKIFRGKRAKLLRKTRVLQAALAVSIVYPAMAILFNGNEKSDSILFPEFQTMGRVFQGEKKSPQLVTPFPDKEQIQKAAADAGMK